MCTITGFGSPTATWGGQLTINGTGFGAPGVLTSGLVALDGLGPQPTVRTWSDTQVVVDLPAAGLRADAGYHVTITPIAIGGLTLGAPCTSTATVAISAGATTFTATRILNDLVLHATSGTFGSTPGRVLVGTIEIGGPLWTSTDITFDITAIPAGTYTITVERANGTSVQLGGVVITATVSAPTTTTIVASPNPAEWGQRVTLTALGLGFGLAPADTTGKVTIDAGGTMTVTVWTPAEIVAVLPTPMTPPTGTRTITVVTGATPSPTVTLDVRTGTSLLGPALPVPNWTSVLRLADGLTVSPELLRAAQLTGVRWRYDYLKAEAIRAASHVQTFEGHLLQVMQLALSKAIAGEQLLNPILIEAVRTLQQGIADIQDLAMNADVTSAISDLARNATQALLLQLLLVWLIEHDAIAFWIGLFEALIDDIASFDAGLGHVTTYLNEQFSLLTIGGKTVTQLVDDLRSSIETQVDAFASPLRQAVAEVVGGVSKGMGEVFKSFDLPLTQKVAGVDLPDIPNADPLAAVSQRLIAAAEVLVTTLKAQILDQLGANLQALFVDVMKTFIVYPVVAIVGVSFVFGGFGAAILAAIIMIAIQELVHLIASWLTGPLLGELEKVKQLVDEAVGKLGAILGREAALLTATSPADLLRALASELRALKDLVPEKFLDELAEVIGRARDTVMRGALQLASAAEQALGLENATAFDAISPSYRAAYTPSLLPGARDPSLFAGAALLRDLGKLEHQRTALADTKEMVVTTRLSVAGLLGGDRGRFLELLRSGQLVINLTEEVLLDRKFPGLYRALIQEVSVCGLFEADLSALSPALGIPVTLTHLGPSRTRVKRNANPFAPPLERPPCLGKADELGRLLQSENMGILDALYVDAIAAWKRNHPPTELPSYLHLLDDSREPQQITVEHAWRAFVQYVPPAVAAKLRAFCPGADAAVFEAGVRAVLEAAAAPIFARADNEWRQIRDGLALLDGGIFGIFGGLFGNTLKEAAMQAVVNGTGVLAPIIPQRLLADSPLRPRVFATAAEITAAKAAATAALAPGLGGLLAAAFAPGIARFNERLAKWGAVELLADPDPAIAAAGFVVLQRDLPAESSVFHLYPAVDSALASRSIASAAPPSALPEHSGTAVQYRPFENRGLGGQLLLALSAVDPIAATGVASDLLGTPAELTPQLPPLTDIILEVTFRACHDAQLAATVHGNRGQRVSALATAAAIARDIPGMLPTSGTGRRTRTVRFSLRAHRDQTLTAWLLALTKNIPVPPTFAALAATDIARQPLATFAGFTPLTGATTNRTYTLRLLNNATFTPDPSALAGIEDVLTVPLVDLGLPAIDASRDVALRQIAVAVIPFRAMPGTIDASLATITTGPFTSIAPAPPSTLPTTHPKRLWIPRSLPTGTPASVLTSSLPTSGGDLAVALLDLTKIYDVLFSITYDLPSALVDATAGGLA